MKKIIACCLITILILSFVGCNFGGEQQQQEGGEERTLYHFSKKAIDSYESLVSAWDIIENSGNKIGDISPYAVKDSLGEDYKVLYYFEQPCKDTYYPISFEEFFEKQTNGVFTNKIYLLNDEDYDNCCDENPHIHDLLLYKEDEDYEKFSKYNGYPVIDVAGFYAVKIENKELVSLVEDEKTANGRYGYTVRYGDRDILSIESCVFITDDLLDLIIENLVILGENDNLCKNEEVIELSEQCFNAVINSIEVIGLDDN